MTRLPRGARCATHMTASASCERDSARGSHRASQHAVPDRVRRLRSDRRGPVWATGSRGCCGWTSHMGECTGSTRRQAATTSSVWASRSVRSACAPAAALSWPSRMVSHCLTRTGNMSSRSRSSSTLWGLGKPIWVSCGINRLSSAPLRCGKCPPEDQSEWQIEWQMELAWARPVLANAGLCSCFRTSAALPRTACGIDDPAGYLVDEAVELRRRCEPERLQQVVTGALYRAARCFSDPICAMRTPQDPEDFLHGAACHCCVMASETSCERANRSG